LNSRYILCLLSCVTAWSTAETADLVIEITPGRTPQRVTLETDDGSAASVMVPPGDANLRVANSESVGPRVADLDSPMTAGVGGVCVENWVNSGGNAGRNAQSDEIGPATASELWSGGRPSLIAWQPVIDGGRAVMVRMTDFGSSGDPEASPVVAMDLNTGDELWFTHLPYQPGDWTSWVAGVRDGRVYAANSGNGASVAAKVYGLDIATGDVVWESVDTVTAGPYDGVVFAPDGDLIVGNFRSIMRIDADDGSTVWSTPRTCSVSSSCGVAVHGDSVYGVDSIFGGHAVERYDLATGANLYAGPIMAGSIAQSTPLVAPDGTIYFSRTQNNPTVDHFYSHSDTGSEIVRNWEVPARWTTHSELGVIPDGSPLMVAPGDELHRLDPATGAMTGTTGPLAALTGSRIVVDGEGVVYLSNEEFSDGRLWAFTSDLDPIWDVPLVNINIGGPALGRAGTLVVCGVGTDVRAYRDPGATGVCAIFVDGFESGDTSAWNTVVPR
jgi:hypothetical protein